MILRQPKALQLLMTLFIAFQSAGFATAQDRLKFPEKIIIDADVGIDDAMAIAFALGNSEFEVLGITTTFGNASIENSTKNALYLVERFGVDIPVVSGAPDPIKMAAEPPADFVHGANGLGDIPVSVATSATPAPGDAADFILAQTRLYPGDVTVVAVGRLTNLAIALERDPSLVDRVKRVVLMGGAFTVPGNVTPVGEANIIGDPHAADRVMTAGWDVAAFGLDVTMQINVTRDDVAALAQTHPTTGQFINDITQFYLAFYESTGFDKGFALHDPTPLIYLLRPDLFTMREAAVRVDVDGLGKGQTIAGFPPFDTRDGAWKDRPAIRFAVDVDEVAARDIFLAAVASAEMQYP